MLPDCFAKHKVQTKASDPLNFGSPDALILVQKAGSDFVAKNYIHNSGLFFAVVEFVS